MVSNNPTEKVAHTPGPWRAREYPNAEGGIWIDCDSWKHKGRGGCQGGTLATAHKTGTGKGSVEANARLIAAAPDLLALAHQYASECSGCDGSGQQPVTVNAGELETTDCPDCADIRAVINKAEGRENGRE